VLVHDDLLATGGTAGATASLIQDLGGVVAGFSFLINLSFLPGERYLTEHFGLKPQYLVSY
jgi:adenine phosphoribosyltransferase